MALALRQNLNLTRAGLITARDRDHDRTGGDMPARARSLAPFSSLHLYFSTDYLYDGGLSLDRNPLRGHRKR
eukprot:3716884-Rhodomonas_salina.2